jgi:hypothetical protein
LFGILVNGCELCAITGNQQQRLFGEKFDAPRIEGLRQSLPTERKSRCLRRGFRRAGTARALSSTPVAASTEIAAQHSPPLHQCIGVAYLLSVHCGAHIAGSSSSNPLLPRISQRSVVHPCTSASVWHTCLACTAVPTSLAHITSYLLLLLPRISQRSLAHRRTSASVWHAYLACTTVPTSLAPPAPICCFHEYRSVA